ncbi:unnamed protein product [Urochloa humidicola]
MHPNFTKNTPTTRLRPLLGVSFIYGTNSCSKAKLRRLRPLYDASPARRRRHGSGVSCLLPLASRCEQFLTGSPWLLPLLLQIKIQKEQIEIQKEQIKIHACCSLAVAPAQSPQCLLARRSACSLAAAPARVVLAAAGGKGRGADEWSSERERELLLL